MTTIDSKLKVYRQLPSGLCKELDKCISAYSIGFNMNIRKILTKLIHESKQAGYNTVSYEQDLRNLEYGHEVKLERLFQIYSQLKE